MNFIAKVFHTFVLILGTNSSLAQHKAKSALTGTLSKESSRKTLLANAGSAAIGLLAHPGMESLRDDPNFVVRLETNMNRSNSLVSFGKSVQLSGGAYSGLGMLLSVTALAANRMGEADEVSIPFFSNGVTSLVVGGLSVTAGKSLRDKIEAKLEDLSESELEKAVEPELAMLNSFLVLSADEKTVLRESMMSSIVSLRTQQADNGGIDIEDLQKSLLQKLSVKPELHERVASWMKLSKELRTIGPDAMAKAKERIEKDSDQVTRKLIDHVIAVAEEQAKTKPSLLDALRRAKDARDML